MRLKGVEAQLTRVARAEPDDAFRLAALEIAANREAGRRSEDGFLERFTDAWLADRDRYPSWIASTVDGNPLGVCTIALVRALPRPGRVPRWWGHMTTLYVRPEARRLGLADRLLDDALRWCDAADVAWVQLLTNDLARPLLTRRGFADCGADVLRRELPAPVSTLTRGRSTSRVAT